MLRRTIPRVTGWSATEFHQSDTTLGGTRSAREDGRDMPRWGRCARRRATLRGPRGWSDSGAAGFLAPARSAQRVASANPNSEKPGHAAGRTFEGASNRSPCQHGKHANARTDSYSVHHSCRLTKVGLVFSNSCIVARLGKVLGLL